MGEMRLFDAVGYIGGDNSALVKTLSASKNLASKALGVVGGVAKTAAKAMAVASAAIITDITVSVVKYAELEKGVREIVTLFGDMGKQTAVVERELQDLAMNLVGTFGQDIPSAMKATYDAVSAGVQRADLGGFMEQSAKLAVAGVTDISRSVDVLTSTLNAYGMASINAEKVSDRLFATVRLGKTTVEELSSAVGRVAPLASAAGVSLDEMFAALAALTAQGISTRESVSGLKAALGNILKPGKDAKELAQRLGLEFSDMAVRSKGLAGLLREATAATEGNVGQMSILFGSIEALNAILALTSKSGSQSFMKAIKEIGSAAGATDTAFTQMTDTISFQWNRLKGLIGNIFRAKGGGFAETVKAALVKVNEVVAAQIEPLRERMTKFGKVLKQVFDDLFTGDVRKQLGAFFSFLSQISSRIMTDLMPSLSGLGTSLKGIVEKGLDVINDKLRAFLLWLQPAGKARPLVLFRDKIIEIKDAMIKLGAGSKSLSEKIKEMFRTIGREIVEFWNDELADISGWVAKVATRVEEELRIRGPQILEAARTLGREMGGVIGGAMYDAFNNWVSRLGWMERLAADVVHLESQGLPPIQPGPLPPAGSGPQAGGNITNSFAITQAGGENEQALTNRIVSAVLQAQQQGQYSLGAQAVMP